MALMSRHVVSAHAILGLAPPSPGPNARQGLERQPTVKKYRQKPPPDQSRQHGPAAAGIFRLEFPWPQTTPPLLDRWQREQPQYQPSKVSRLHHGRQTRNDPPIDFALTLPLTRSAARPWR
jgi:hypothetical protein